MSSCSPCKSHSGSVHDSDVESSTEYVQIQSPMSPKIPLPTPIASSMNVSGLNIDVGNATSQNSSTWSIPNISVTQILPNPTNTQVHVSEGHEAHQKSHQRIIHNPNFHGTSSLIQVHMGDKKWVDGGQQKIPLKNVTWSGLSVGNPGFTLHQNMVPKGKTVRCQEQIEDCDELYASSPLVHKEKVTGCNHPYASKPIRGHASSSREKIVDHEDENMSPTQGETNDEPRRENFMTHEQGTQSNS
ncbi:hypothetical protein O181_008068 [Austropuccinia psidii MF-1]|uniref:Uncharacterized protein n=1 Tax=Austropuccinia psidii MF-1 TaxID=1389203 RepID=A0A9Q3GI65_9BASI|nr:hypothetical protein [Austropuccinia psidii MF-1]